MINASTIFGEHLCRLPTGSDVMCSCPCDCCRGVCGTGAHILAGHIPSLCRSGVDAALRHQKLDPGDGEPKIEEIEVTTAEAVAEEPEAEPDGEPAPVPAPPVIENRPADPEGKRGSRRG